jgi:putative toxin-antitoxin system antitoxin component (TIGR02293 family)
MASVFREEEETRRVVSLLGGRKAFARRVSSAADMQAALRSGLSYAAFEAVLSALQLDAATLVGLVGTSSRTMARRKKERVLSPTESDRLYRVARVSLEATDTFGSFEKARLWLHRPNQALSGETPLDQLDTEIGERQVEILLGRIEHGLYS